MIHSRQFEDILSERKRVHNDDSKTEHSFIDRQTMKHSVSDRECLLGKRASIVWNTPTFRHGT